MQNDASMPQTANICWGLQLLPAHVTGDKVSTLSILIFQTSDYDAPTPHSDDFSLYQLTWKMGDKHTLQKKADILHMFT